MGSWFKGWRTETLPTRLDTTFLDGLRGLAALYVLIHHADYLLRRGFLTQMQSYGKLIPAETHATFYHYLTMGLSVFRYGHAAVVFFFVLSGFVIHLRYAKQFAKAAAQPGVHAIEFAVGDYFWRRVRRIYPPVLLAIVVTTIFDIVGMHLGYAIYRSATPYAWLNGFTPDHGVLTLLGNLAFVMDVYVRPWGVDIPLWSLAYEWWFYMLYPLLWWGSRRSIPGVTAVVVAASLLTMLPIPQPLIVHRVIGSLPAWFLGALLADVYAGRIRISYAKLIPLTVVLAAFNIRSLPEAAKTNILALGFVGLISLMFWLEQRAWILRPLNVLKPLGDFSYSLYVLHMPMLVFGSGLLMAMRGTLPDAPWAMLIGIAACIAVAWAAHFVVEVPFTRQARPKTARVATKDLPAQTSDKPLASTEA